MPLKIIGEHPLARNDRGELKSRIGTVFPRRRALITLPGIHAWQRLAFLDFLNERRQGEGLPAFSQDEEGAEIEQSVDLIIEQDQNKDYVLIRPDPENMPLAFEADELLQELVPKQQIRFLLARNEKVRQAIKERGENWRISPLPQSPSEMVRMIRQSKAPILGDPIYYYNKITGTRYLTFQEFAQLEKRGPACVTRHLREIGEWSGKKNRLGNPEVDFFLTDDLFGRADFAETDLETTDPAPLLAAYRALKERFQRAVPAELRVDNPEQPEWRNYMIAALIGQQTDTQVQDILHGLSPEFYLQVEWLPGGRIEDGELMFDPIFDETGHPEQNQNGKSLCDQKVKGFIFNLIREYGDLEYINVGRVASSMSKRQQAPGRRDVYIAELKPRGVEQRVVRIIRMQKWGIRERLTEGKDLLTAIIESEEYTEYVLNRRLGCRQLGMNLPHKISMGRISEKYDGPRTEFIDRVFGATYFERDYIPGIATDKIAESRFANPEYALRFARLLGRAAAPNMIVGRLHLDRKAVFDDGDETLTEDENQLPKDILVTDHTGGFGDFESNLLTFAEAYAQPVIKRFSWLPQPMEFSRIYIESFIERFLAIQADYRKRRRAFDSLFQHCVRDEHGSFAYRWEKVLERLDRTDARELGESIKTFLPK